ncbi:MAG: DoxX family protein [Planctomycetota bacterium]
MWQRFLTYANAGLGLAILRVIVGVAFTYHGAQKVFGIWGGHGIDGFAGYLDSLGLPLPVVQAWLAALAEFLGGLAFILGAFTRIAAVPLTVTMLVAIFLAHGGRYGESEHAINLLGGVICIALAGPGCYALHRKLR